MNVTLVPGHLQDAVGRQRPLSGLSRAELCLGMDLLARMVHTSDGIEVLRPGELRRPLDEIQAFRRDLYRERSPHLLSPAQEAIERDLDIDRTSLHSVAEREGTIVGTLRVKSWPFEASKLSPDLEEAVGRRRDFAEISRFVVHPGAQGAHVGEKLFWGSLRWLCHQTDLRGILWICRPAVLPYFMKYGVEAEDVQSVRVPSRGEGDYRLVAVDFPTVLDAVLRIVREHPEELVKRKEKAAEAPCARLHSASPGSRSS